MRVLVSPIHDSSTIEQFNAALLGASSVVSAELEQFVGQTAVLAVDATSASDLISALLGLDRFPLTGLTVAADGQLSVRLDESGAAHRDLPATAGPVFATPSAPVLPAPAVQQSPQPDPTADPLQNLRDTVSRLSGRINQVLHEGRSGVVIPQRPTPPVETAPVAWEEQRAATAFDATVQAAHLRSITRPADYEPHGEQAGAALQATTSPAAVAATEDDGRAVRHFFRHATPVEPVVAAPEGVPEPLLTDTPLPDEHDTLPIFADVSALPADEAAPIARAQAPAVPDDMSDTTEPSPVTARQAFLANREAFAALDEPLTPEATIRSVGASAAVADAGETVQQPAETQDKLQVVAYPFENFAVVNSFISALRRLPDVRHVAPRRFRGGAIQLSVDYSGAEPFANLIGTLTHFEPQIVSDDGETINVAIGGAQ
ncbi:MAG: hypothetical protein ACYDCQ_11695 [Dehalococcoidia bacterium]